MMVLQTTLLVSHSILGILKIMVSKFIVIDQVTNGLGTLKGRYYDEYTYIRFEFSVG